jgi:hypothetical protein
MITGFITDVRHQEVVFHVQTEDKGAANPFIESMIYVGGQVLATKRASYANLLSEGKDEKAIVALMDHQHRTMIAAIKHGKFDEKVGTLAASRQTGRHAAVVVPQPTMRPAAPPAPVAPAAALDRTAAVPAPPPARAPERTLDQVILEYLTNEADQEQLLLMVEGDQQLALGRNAYLTLRTSSSKSGLPIAGAQVTVKMISTVAEPRALAAGQTDEAGTLDLSLAIPPLHRGTAALIITAVSAIGRAELKHLL